VSHFGHVDLRVTDLTDALQFYDQVLPALGFSERYHGEAWKVWATTESLPSTAYVAVTEDRAHVANGNRIAFWVSSDAEVDRVTAVARGAGARSVSGAKPMPYSPGYYASFFSDPSGNLLEIYVRPR
jgi:catechol 2,3-dioxygenase-like lactoylglutathione lyase family enzyme